MSGFEHLSAPHQEEGKRIELLPALVLAPLPRLGVSELVRTGVGDFVYVGYVEERARCAWPAPAGPVLCGCDFIL